MTITEGGIMSADGYTLIIGDKNFSSWSLRLWLAMKHCGIPFAEERLRLRQPESKAAILRHSPSGKVPALKTNGLVVFDSLAILEFLAERHPETQMWPHDLQARALARSISAEMHSGFVTLRNDMSMDLLARFPPADWRRLRPRHLNTATPERSCSAPFSNADAMYAPVATRFRTYGVDLSAFGDDGNAASYAEVVLTLPKMAEWVAGAEEEIRARLSA
jgi:glutathione S-transferase